MTDPNLYPDEVPQQYPDVSPTELLVPGTATCRNPECTNAGEELAVQVMPEFAVVVCGICGGACELVMEG